MDESRRQITKIAREVGKFTVRTLKEDGIGTSEYDFLHAVRKNPGITQAEVRALLGLDKGACARRTAALVKKGYLTGRPDEHDGRRTLLFATEQAERLKRSKTAVEASCYEWLLEGLPEAERAEFVRLLRKVYARSKQESLAGFPNLTRRCEGGAEK